MTDHPELPALVPIAKEMKCVNGYLLILDMT